MRASFTAAVWSSVRHQAPDESRTCWPSSRPPPPTVVACSTGASCAPRRTASSSSGSASTTDALPAALWPALAFQSMKQIELRETRRSTPKQPAITRDNDMEIDGVVYLRIIDPYKANYAVSHAVDSCSARPTTVRSKIGEMTLDQTFKNREELNTAVVEGLRRVGQEWGIVVTRYEVKDIDPPASIINAMKAEAEAERKKRAMVLESEGYRQAAINKAEGEKTSAVLESEAQRLARSTWQRARRRLPCRRGGRRRSQPGSGGGGESDERARRGAVTTGGSGGQWALANRCAIERPPCASVCGRRRGPTQLVSTACAGTSAPSATSSSARAPCSSRQRGRRRLDGHAGRSDVDGFAHHTYSPVDVFRSPWSVQSSGAA